MVKSLGEHTCSFVRSWEEERKRAIDAQEKDALAWNSDVARQDAIVSHAIEQNEARNKRILESVISAWIGWGVPRRVAEILPHAQSTEAVSSVSDFVDGPGTFLILAGGVGCGKTVAACSAAKRGGAFFFVDALDLVKVGLYGERAEIFWEHAEGAEMLVLDDIGVEPRDEKGYAQAALEDLINKRYNSKRKTILTTNLSADVFRSKYCQGPGGGRLGDRLREAGEWVALTGKSMRKG